MSKSSDNDTIKDEMSHATTEDFLDQLKYMTKPEKFFKQPKLLDGRAKYDKVTGMPIIKKSGDNKCLFNYLFYYLLIVYLIIYFIVY